MTNQDPWARAVVAVADQRCGSLSPDAIILRKLGARAWGGIGLAAAMVVTLGALSALPADSRAREDAFARSEATAAVTTGDTPDAAEPREARSPKFDPAEGAISGESPETAEPSARVGQPTALRSADPSSGNGTGVGRTNSKPHGELTPAGHGGDATMGTAPAGGGATGQIPPPTASTAAGTTTAARLSKPSSPPWQSPSWPADRADALRAVQTGRVPDNCRDVVREYFRDSGDGDNVR